MRVVVFVGDLRMDREMVDGLMDGPAALLPCLCRTRCRLLLGTSCLTEKHSCKYSQTAIIPKYQQLVS